MKFKIGQRIINYTLANPRDYRTDYPTEYVKETIGQPLTITDITDGLIQTDFVLSDGYLFWFEIQSDYYLHSQIK